MSARRGIFAILRERSHRIRTGTCSSMPWVDLRRVLRVQRKTVRNLTAITKVSAVLTPGPVSRNLRQALATFLRQPSAPTRIVTTGASR